MDFALAALRGHCAALLKQTCHQQTRILTLWSTFLRSSKISRPWPLALSTPSHTEKWLIQAAPLWRHTQASLTQQDLSFPRQLIQDWPNHSVNAGINKDLSPLHYISIDVVARIISKPGPLTQTSKNWYSPRACTVHPQDRRNPSQHAVVRAALRGHCTTLLTTERAINLCYLRFSPCEKAYPPACTTSTIFSPLDLQ